MYLVKELCLENVVRSLSTGKSIIMQKFVKVNGVVVTDILYPLKVGDIIEIKGTRIEKFVVKGDNKC